MTTERNIGSRGGASHSRRSRDSVWDALEVTPDGVHVTGTAWEKAEYVPLP
jgi:hypothetical protein